MELNKLQNSVEEFINRNDLRTTTEIRVLDLVSEVGELSKEVLHANSYGKKTLNLKAGDFSQEMGDVLFSLICIANNTDINLEDALLRALEKYQNRIDERGNPASNR